MKTFAQLFKKYRLRSEFETISSFSDALAEKEQLICCYLLLAILS
jgi:hypothetical protein